MASDFFGRQRECRLYTAGCENKMAVSVTGPWAVNESGAQSYRVEDGLVVVVVCHVGSAVPPGTSRLLPGPGYA